MTKQEEIREGLIQTMLGTWRRTTSDSADEILSYLHSQDVVIKVGRELPDSPYDSLIFPTTTEEAGKFLSDKGLTDREKTAVSGTIARLGWENCAKIMDEAGYEATEPLITERRDDAHRQSQNDSKLRDKAMRPDGSSEHD